MMKTDMRHSLLALLCDAVLQTAQAAPPVAAPPPSEPVFAPATISSEAYEPKTTLEVEAMPNCQIKIGSNWSETPAKTLEDCGALLDEKAPLQARPMSTAYWNHLYLAADDKNIYKAAAEADAWSVLAPRRKR